jgi:amino acid transporter
LWSLLTQLAITLALLAGVGTASGRAAILGLLTGLGFQQVSWEGHGGFDTLLSWTAPVFWLFFLSTGFALFVLRVKDRGTLRPFPVPLYPLLPLIFCASCAYMLYSAAAYAGKLALLPGVLVLAGLILYAPSKRQEIPKAE